MSVFFLLALGYAEPISGDTQVVIGQKGFAFAADYLAQIPLHMEQEIIAAPYECWDLVGVQDFNLQTQIEEAYFTTETDALILQLWFQPITGSNIIIFAEDTDTFDLCPSYQSTLNYLTITDLYVELSLYPYLDDSGNMVLEVLSTPIVEGDLDMDVSWFPDNLVLYFFEQRVFETIAWQMEEQIPAMVAEYTDIFQYQMPIDPLDFGLYLSDTTTSPDGLFMAAKTTVHYNEESPCAHNPIDPQGRAPSLPFSDIDEAALGFGLTEKAINKATHNLWRDGYFCFAPSDFDSLFDEISGFFDASIAELDGNATLNTPPSVEINEDGIFLHIEGGELSVQALSTDVNFIDISLNIDAKIDFNLDRNSSSFGLTLHDLQMDFISFHIEGLLSDNPYATENVKRFIEIWMVSKIEDQIKDIPLFASIFQVFDLYIFVDNLRYIPGGFEIYVNLFQEGDPAIDSTPPETTLDIISLNETEIIIEADGTDDRTDELVYSYRFDNESWSSWSSETTIYRNDLLYGNHIIQVKSRDKWWNEDASPALESFFVEEPSTEEEDKEPSDVLPTSCGGCSSTKTFPSSLYWILAMCWAYRRK